MTAARADLASLPGWPRLLSADQAAAYCGISRTTFLRRIEEGTYPPGRKDGGRVVWDKVVLDKVLDKLAGIDIELSDNSKSGSGSGVINLADLLD